MDSSEKVLYKKTFAIDFDSLCVRTYDGKAFLSETPSRHMFAISGISALDSFFWQIKNLAGCKNRNNNGIRNEIKTRVFTQGTKYVYVRHRQEF